MSNYGPSPSITTCMQKKRKGVLAAASAAAILVVATAFATYVNVNARTTGLHTSLVRRDVFDGAANTAKGRDKIRVRPASASRSSEGVDASLVRQSKHSLSLQGVATDCRPKIFKAAHNGRKYMASVVGLPTDAGVYGANVKRLPIFMNAWARAWPGLNIRHQPTIKNHPQLMGYGVAVGYFLALTESLTYLQARNETCDYHLMFEDDALPFNETTWPSHGKHNSLDSRLDELTVRRGTAMLLGGHDFIGVNKTDAELLASRVHGGITHASMAFGAYALVLKCSVLDAVAKHLFNHLQNTYGKTSSFEKVLWGIHDALQEHGVGSGVYVSVPLLVDHAHGFSATWNRDRLRPFEGNAKFW